MGRRIDPSLASREPDLAAAKPPLSAYIRAKNEARMIGDVVSAAPPGGAVQLRV
jgi:hypothetical protein